MNGVAAVREYLAGVAGVTALVGDRVYRKVPRGAVLPYVRVIRNDINHNPTLDGTAGHMKFEEIDVDSVGPTAAVADAVDAAVRDALQDWSGTAAGVTVDAVIIEGGPESTEPPANGEDSGVSLISQAYLIQWH